MLRRSELIAPFVEDDSSYLLCDRQKEKEPTAQEKKRNPTKVNNLQNDEKIDEFNSNHFGSYIESYSLSGDEINYKKFFNEEHWEIEEREMIRKFMIDRNVEVVVLVEGQDALTGKCCLRHFT